MTFAPIKRLRPLLTPQEIREATVRDYTRAAERAGAPSDARTIERQAVADCELVDRYNAGNPAPDPAKVGAARKAEKVKRAAKRANAYADAGLEVVAPMRTTPQIVRTAHMPCETDTRWMLARGRAKRILEGTAASSDPFTATRTATIPDLAFRLMRIYADFATRNIPRRQGDEANPFFGLKPGDTARVLQRLVEDVCDASSGRMGPWFVPK